MLLTTTIQAVSNTLTLTTAAFLTLVKNQLYKFTDQTITDTALKEIISKTARATITVQSPSSETTARLGVNNTVTSDATAQGITAVINNDPTKGSYQFGLEALQSSTNFFTTTTATDSLFTVCVGIQDSFLNGLAIFSQTAEGTNPDRTTPNPTQLKDVNTPDREWAGCTTSGSLSDYHQPRPEWNKNFRVTPDLITSVGSSTLYTNPQQTDMKDLLRDNVITKRSVEDDQAPTVGKTPESANSVNSYFSQGTN